VPAALACTWGATTIKIMPLNHGWSFCCPGLSGTVAHPASIQYSSVNNDNYSVRPGIASAQLSRCVARENDGDNAGDAQCSSRFSRTQLL